MDRAAALERIVQERARQDEKWGEQNHEPVVWSAILTEECGEVARAALEKDGAAYVKELVQVAAVAVAAIESIVRAGGRRD